MASIKRKTFTSWQLPDGTRTKPNTPGAAKVKSPSTKWYGKYRGPDGIVREVPLCKDKRAAAAMLRDLESKAERVHSGMEAPQDDRHPTVPSPITWTTMNVRCWRKA